MIVLTKQHWAQVQTRMQVEMLETTDAVYSDHPVPGKPAALCVAVTGSFSLAVIFLTVLAEVIASAEGTDTVQEIRHLADRVVKEWHRGRPVYCVPSVRVEL